MLCIQISGPLLGACPRTEAYQLFGVPTRLRTASSAGPMLTPAQPTCRLVQPHPTFPIDSLRLPTQQNNRAGEQQANTGPLDFAKTYMLLAESVSLALYTGMTH